MGESAGEEFAAALSALKRRSGLSYGTLARQLNYSTSTLHRHCSGAAIPTDYAQVERLARACGAEPRELVELHRLWLLADAERHRKPPRASSTEGRAPSLEPLAQAGAAAPETDAAGAGGADGPGTAGTAMADGPADGPADDPAGGPANAAAGEGTAGRADDPSAEGQRTPVAARRWRALRWVSLAACLSLVLLGVAAQVGFRPWQGEPAAARGAPEDASDPPDAATGTPERPDPPAEPSPTAAESDPPPDDAPDGTPEQPPDDAAEPPPDGAAVELPADRAPLDWTVRSQVWRTTCSHPYLVDREPDEVPGAPLQQDSEEWAAGVGAVHGGSTVVETTLRPAHGEPVVVEAVHVRVEGRGAPLPWNLYHTGRACGGALVQAAYRVDLDAEAPQPVPEDGFDPNTEESVPPPHLPFQVSDDEPLSLRVEAETERCDCTWRIEVEWSSGRHRGTVTVDDAGRPFRTAAPGDGDSYVPDRGGWLAESG